MGEDETIDFESLKHTLVFWNMDDYPIPVDTTDDLGPVFGDISKALDLMGFRLGFMDVRLYSEQHNYDKKLADIIRPSLPKCRSYSGCVYKVPDITLHMILHASYIGPGPVNFFVIAKPQRELLRVLQCLKLRRHNVLLVKPPPPDEECLFSVDSLLKYARLLGGGKPRYNPLQGYMDEFDSSLEKYIEIKEDVSKTVDFSALVEREFSDNITIWAYLDDDDNKKGSWLGGDKTWASRIYFLPGGDKASRRIRMINDIHLWMRDSPHMSTSYEASLVLFSDQFKDDDVYYRDMLQRLGNMRYYVLLVTPALDINKPETPEWPGLLIDRGAYFFDQVKSQIYQGPDDAAAEEETPPIMSDMDYSLLCPFGDQTSESSEDEDSPFWPPRTDDMLIDGGQSSAEQETPVYRWDPFTLMYKLESLFPKENEADTEEEETPEKLATHGTCRLDPTSFEWPGRQIDGGSGWGSSEEPCPKRHKAEENT
ncbi:BnaAnng24850D [Brassica napus]|uniref:BnaAnng24850D protein n=1 Tax=Brassica napus TaxID=3708 RepID=A0A078JLE6_BRANA|nr:BnaAnng24850D [Brassica napus]